jgi:1-acyl-sn-glycerol-3-phosphate acyltransferase
MLGWLFYTFLWITLNGMRAVGWLRWRVEGLENLPPGGAVLISNHIHWLDIPVHGTLLPFGRRPMWIAKAELLETWFGRALLKRNMIPIRRGQRDVGALDVGVQALKDGRLVLIYPEGTRSRTGILQKGKPGALILAARSGRPLVPMAVVGTESGARGSLSRRPVVLRIGKPFDAPLAPDAEHALRALSAHTTDMMRHVAALLPPDQRGLYADVPAVTQ